ncbi:hypothetical protein AAT19DRAFT_9675 [Rhodotorula toruloides]|uniref:Uncharacterized protein n=1 Tax=Rhodotorula toruloides TaxID=5286 RepID=A0A2T0A300_RHOTO|nr:hypothetical protein AAT19DRAFT_9675 [Rhodotorula toruloides]
MSTAEVCALPCCPGPLNCHQIPTVQLHQVKIVCVCGGCQDATSFPRSLPTSLAPSSTPDVPLPSPNAFRSPRPSPSSPDGTPAPFNPDRSSTPSLPHHIPLRTLITLVALSPLSLRLFRREYSNPDNLLLQPDCDTPSVHRPRHSTILSLPMPAPAQLA